MRRASHQARQLIVVYRTMPERLRALLPRSVTPRIVGEQALVGLWICSRPAPWAPVCPASMRATERLVMFASVTRRRRGAGIHIVRRDTNSRLLAWWGHCRVGRRAHHSRISIDQERDRIEVCADSDDAAISLRLRGHLQPTMLQPSVLCSPAGAMDQLRHCLEQLGAIGASPVGDTPHGTRWRLMPVHVHQVETHIQEWATGLADDDLCFDSAFVLRSVEPVWRAHESVCYEGLTG